MFIEKGVVEFDDVGVVESGVHFDLFFSFLEVLVCVFDVLESKGLVMLVFNQVDNSKTSFTQAFNEGVTVDSTQIHCEICLFSDSMKS